MSNVTTTQNVIDVSISKTLLQTLLQTKIIDVHIYKDGVTIIDVDVDYTFEADVNGDAMPRIGPEASAWWDIDGNGDIMPKDGIVVVQPPWLEDTNNDIMLNY